MALLCIALTAAVILGAMGVAYSRSKDALHPLMILGPMLLFVYVVRPSMLLGRDQMQPYLTPEQIAFAQAFFCMSIASLCLGALWGSGRGRARVWFAVTPKMRRRLVNLGVFLGFLAVGSYWYCLYRSGGFLTVYSRAKGQFSAGSGWINELVTLSIPAVVLMVLAWNGERRYRHYLFWGAVFASPMLMHGLFGARRGPTFMVLAAVLVAWYVRLRKRVSLWKVTTRFGLICLLAMFLVSQRRNIYIGSDFDLNLGEFWNRVAAQEVDSTDDTILMYGFLNAVRDTKTCYYGVRYAATYFVRPIPRQIWPTKYTDLGLGWMVNQSEFGGIADQQWMEILGWVPARGSAVGFAGDLFIEFRWGAPIGCFVMGWFFGRLWRNASRRGGVWTLLYVQAAALSIYVPTQSVSAVFHRFLFIAVPTYFIWRYYIGRMSSPLPQQLVQAGPPARNAAPLAAGSVPLTSNENAPSHRPVYGPY
ncbi:MAG: hypothetical protein AB7O26_04050 [Planctomycetaceae bacterium]